MSLPLLKQGNEDKITLMHKSNIFDERRRLVTRGRKYYVASSYDNLRPMFTASSLLRQ